MTGYNGIQTMMLAGNGSAASVTAGQATFKFYNGKGKGSLSATKIIKLDGKGYTGSDIKTIGNISYSSAVNGSSNDVFKTNFSTLGIPANCIV